VTVTNAQVPDIEYSRIIRRAPCTDSAVSINSFSWHPPGSMGQCTGKHAVQPCMEAGLPAIPAATNTPTSEDVGMATPTARLPGERAGWQPEWEPAGQPPSKAGKEDEVRSSEEVGVPAILPVSSGRQERHSQEAKQGVSETTSQAPGNACGQADGGTGKHEGKPEEERDSTGLYIRAPVAKTQAAELFQAVRRGDQPTVQALLENSAELQANSVGMWGNTPLLVACQYGHGALASFLLQKHQADPCIVNGEGGSALLFAITEGQGGVAHELIIHLSRLMTSQPAKNDTENSASGAQRCAAGTPQTADSTRCPSSLSFLDRPVRCMHSGVDVLKPWTPLTAACAAGSVQLVKALIRIWSPSKSHLQAAIETSCAFVRADSLSALAELACTSGTPEADVVDPKLARTNADPPVDRRSANQWKAAGSPAPLVEACEFARRQAGKARMSPAEPSALKQTSNGTVTESALPPVVRSGGSASDHKEAHEKCRAGGSTGSTDTAQQAGSHSGSNSVSQADQLVCEVLSALPPSLCPVFLRHRTPRGEDPLLAACQCNLPAAALKMVELGAPVNATQAAEQAQGARAPPTTALHAAIQASMLPVVKGLLRAGADAKALDRHKRTPKDLAGRSRFAAEILTLLEEAERQAQGIQESEGGDEKAP